MNEFEEQKVQTITAALKVARSIFEMNLKNNKNPQLLVIATDLLKIIYQK